MITVGIDLASQPTKTGLATIEWTDSAAVVREVTVGVVDEQIVEAVLGSDKAGIDCPFGWPDRFVLGEHEQLCRTNDDAVIAALATRAAAVDLVAWPDPHQRELAALEGWIAVPESGSLAKLVGG